jgi:hypothetical protein
MAAREKLVGARRGEGAYQIKRSVTEPLGSRTSANAPAGFHQQTALRHLFRSSRELCQRAMKPPDPCAVSRSHPCPWQIDEQSHFAFRPSHLSWARPVPQWVRQSNFDLGIPRSDIKSYADRRPVPPPAYEPRSKRPIHFTDPNVNLVGRWCSAAQTSSPFFDDSIRTPKRFHRISSA